MKHPVRDRFWVLFCALAALCGAAWAVALVLGKITVDPAVLVLGRISNMSFRVKLFLVAAAAVLLALALRLIAITLPPKKKRSSNFAIQRNENGMVRISLKALEALVQRCLNQHSEIKVVSSSLSSDEESIRVDVHIALQSDISMPLAISSLQKQIKRYIEACSGVKVEEVRVFVDGTLPRSANAEESPFAIPANLLGQEPIVGADESAPAVTEDVTAEAAPAEEAAREEEREEAAEEAAKEADAEETVQTAEEAEEAAVPEDAAPEDTAQEKTGEEA